MAAAAVNALASDEPNDGALPAAGSIGVGIGPGDPDLLTVKATRVMAASPVVAYFAKAGRRGNARAIVDGWLKPGAVELPLYYPMTTELAFRRSAATATRSARFYEASAVGRSPRISQPGATSRC